MKRLVVDGYGKFVGRRKNQIVVREEGKVLHSVLAEDLRQVVISGRGGISFDAMELLGEYGVDLVVIDWKGSVTARLSSSMMRTVQTRREQYYAYRDVRGGYLAKQFVLAKMRNQYAVLGTLAKTRKETSPEASEAMVRSRQAVMEGINMIEGAENREADLIRETLMGTEGRASKHYWDAVAQAIPGDYSFPGRTGRYARDPVNSMLNYGYALLEGEVWRGVHYAGLDPYGGYLHVDRPGRPSMVLDLMEEFRQQVVDKTVIGLAAKRAVAPDGFEEREGLCEMRDAVRRMLLEEVLGKFERYVRHGDRKLRWADLILMQAREVARFLRGEAKAYEGFYLRW